MIAIFFVSSVGGILQKNRLSGFSSHFHGGGTRNSNSTQNFGLEKVKRLLFIFSSTFNSNSLGLSGRLRLSGQDGDLRKTRLCAANWRFHGEQEQHRTDCAPIGIRGGPRNCFRGGSNQNTQFLKRFQNFEAPFFVRCVKNS